MDWAPLNFIILSGLYQGLFIYPAKTHVANRPYNLSS